MNRYCIQTYLIGQGIWQDEISFGNIVEAAIEYESLRLNFPTIAYRFIMVLEER